MQAGGLVYRRKVADRSSYLYTIPYIWLKQGFSVRWKMILNVATLLALVVLVVAIWDRLVETFNNIVRVNTWALLMMIPLRALNYDSQTRLYQHLFSMVGNKLRHKQLFRSSLELNFVNHVFPSGGVTGISYFRHPHERRRAERCEGHGSASAETGAAFHVV